MDGSLFSRREKDLESRTSYDKPRHAPTAHIHLEQYRDQFPLQLLVHLRWSGPHARQGRRRRLTSPPPRCLGFKEGSPLLEVAVLSDSLGQDGGNDLSAKSTVRLG